MNNSASSRSSRSIGVGLRSTAASALVGGLLGAVLSAATGFGTAVAATPDTPAGAAPLRVAAADTARRAAPTQRQWMVRDHSEIRLVPRENGAAANQHPALLDSEVLRRQLAEIGFDADGRSRQLFTADEASELAEPLSQALANAGPADDVLLLSSARRPDAPLMRPVAVTARVFVASGRLQFIVHDARFEFYNAMRGSNRAPEFSYGSRTQAGSAVLRDAAASAVRADWLALPLAVAGASIAPAAVAAPAATAAPNAAAPVSAPAAAAPAAPAAPRVRDAAFYDEQAQRLAGLKRLREQGLLTEQEYEQKRRQIVDGL